MPLLDALSPHVAAMAARAGALDEAAAFPTEDIRLLVDLGLLTAPLPARLGGQGAGTEAGGSAVIFGLLRLLGRGNLAVARLFEAHVNVLRLVMRFGAATQQEDVARLCRAGALFGLWVTDAPRQRLTRAADSLVGSKGPCSGAGHLRHALVTVSEGEGVRMALVALDGSEPTTTLAPRLHGMRAAANGTVQLDGVAAPDSALLGGDGDYLAEPDFSTGAWRTSAATVGGMDALVDATRSQLVARRHDGFPLQQARFGEMLIAQGTARLWAREAAEMAEAGTAPVADQVAHVNLARIAVETACLDLMRLAQRALGLPALLRPNPVERLLRDLATFLRQPAPDLVLTEAAAHALGR